MIYNLKLINSYINGEDIEGYNIEDLENDPEFMKSVILASNDKEFYNLCSEEVKSDFDFVMFLIDKYSFNAKFIDKVASYFLKNSNNESERLSVVVHTCNLFEKLNDKELFAKYRIMFIAKFLTDMIGIEKYKMEKPNDNIGLGFVVFYNEYINNEEVLKYYAVSLINYIFDELGVSLEDDIHKNFRTPNDIYKVGLITYMLNFIRKYDSDLADYATVHQDTLDNFQNKINNIQVRWGKYTDKEEARRYEEMYERVHDYMSDHEMDTLIGEEAFIYYIGRELNISAKLATYSGLDRATYEMINSEVDEDFIKSSLSNMSERIIYSNIKRIMLETIFGEYEEKHSEGKIIEVDFSKMRR